jgi:hypothetical protein
MCHLNASRPPSRSSSFCDHSSPERSSRELEITLFGEQAPTLGTSSPTWRLRAPCWGPAPYVPCYMHPQGNAS